MRAIMTIAVASVLVWQAAGQTQSQDEARAIIGKAIKAMGLDKDKGAEGFRSKSKGTLELMGMTLNVEQNVIIKMTGQFKDMLKLDVNGMEIPIATVYDGKTGWVKVGETVMKLDDKVNAELKDVAGLIQISRLKPLLDKKYKLAVTGEVKVEDKPALGVRVSIKDGKDISLFFDKQTSLLVKLERQALDAATMQEVQEERIIRRYQDKDGQKVPQLLTVLRDGKKFLEAEVIEYEALEKIELSEFEMPK